MIFKEDSLNGRGTQVMTWPDCELLLKYIDLTCEYDRRIHSAICSDYLVYNDNDHNNLLTSVDHSQGTSLGRWVLDVVWLAFTALDILLTPVPIPFLTTSASSRIAARLSVHCKNRTRPLTVSLAKSHKSSSRHIEHQQFFHHHWPFCSKSEGQAILSSTK